MFKIAGAIQAPNVIGYSPGKPKDNRGDAELCHDKQCDLRDKPWHAVDEPVLSLAYRGSVDTIQDRP